MNIMYGMVQPLVMPKIYADGEIPHVAIVSVLIVLDRLLTNGSHIPHIDIS